MGTLSAAGIGTAASTPLLAGDAGTAQTVSLMNQAADKAYRDPFVRAIAGRLVRGLDPSDVAGQARAVWDWFVRHVRFVRDGVGQEVVQDAAWTLQHGFGDCDDMTVALRGLLGSVGIVTRTVTVANIPGEDAFSHVYLEAQLAPGRWIPLDAARPQARFGETGARVSRRQVWSEDGDAAGVGLGWSPGMGTVVWGTRQGMGQDQDDGSDGIDWTAVTQAIAAGGAAAANIITAARANPNLLTGLQARGLYPASGAVTYGGGISFGTTNPTYLMMGGALVLVLLLRR